MIGTPDPDMGEQVTAFVQPDPAVGADARDCRPSSSPTAASRLAHFKCPRRVEFVDELPRLPTGKLLKRLLR